MTGEAEVILIERGGTPGAHFSIKGGAVDLAAMFQATEMIIGLQRQPRLDSLAPGGGGVQPKAFPEEGIGRPNGNQSSNAYFPALGCPSPRLMEVSWVLHHCNTLDPSYLASTTEAPQLKQAILPLK